MANRTFDTEFLTIQKRVISLWAVVAVPTGTTPVLQKYNYGTFGAGAGYVAAPTTGGGSGQFTRYAQGAEGIFSVTRTGVGLWTVVLQDQYKRVLGIQASMIITGASPNIVQTAENGAITNMVSTGGSTIGVALLSASGVLADPTASASTQLRIRFDLQDATEP